MKKATDKLGDILVRQGLITAEQLKRALQEQKGTGMRLGYTLVKLGFIDETEITKMLARHYRMPAVDLSRFEVDPKILKLLPGDIAAKHGVLPLKREGRTLTVAIADPNNVAAIEDIKFITRMDVFPVVAGEYTLRNAIDRYYQQSDAQLASLLKSVEDADDLEVVEEQQDEEVRAQDLAEDAPVVKLIDGILTDAPVAVVVASYEHPLTWDTAALVVVAFACARFVAMGFNRLADRALGEALMEAGRRDRGIEDLELLRLDPTSIRHRQKAVEFAFKAGDKPKLIEAYLELADTLLRANLPDRARAVYERVAEHDPGNQRAKAALSMFGAPPAQARPEGKVKREEPTGDEEQDFHEMLARFKQGIGENIDEADFESHYDLGVAFKEMGLRDEAIAEFQKALDARYRRTQGCELVTGRLTVRQAWIVVAIAAAGFLAAAWALSPLCGRLALPALLWIAAYSYTKRFTHWSYVWLGLVLVDRIP